MTYLLGLSALILAITAAVFAQQLHAAQHYSVRPRWRQHHLPLLLIITALLILSAGWLLTNIFIAIPELPDMESPWPPPRWPALPMALNVTGLLTCLALWRMQLDPQGWEHRYR